MPKQKDVLIMIPAYNEEENIGALLDQLLKPEIRDFADILVMDDASTDRTSQIVRERGVNCISHIYQLGYGSGLQVGYNYAREHQYRFVIQMDADGQHDVCNVPVIYRELQRKDEKGFYPDIVLGSRFVDGTEKPKGLKALAIRLFRWVIRMATGRTIADPTSGLQGLSKHAYYYYSEAGHFDDRYPDANMIMQMLYLGFHLREVPATMHNRTHGKSMHSGLKPAIYMMRMFFSMLAVWLRCEMFHEKLEES